VLRPAQRPSGREIVTLLRRLIGRIRANWPRIEILLRGDSRYCTPDTGVRGPWAHAAGVGTRKPADSLGSGLGRRPKRSKNLDTRLHA
jgi:hypothetical protein